MRFAWAVGKNVRAEGDASTNPIFKCPSEPSSDSSFGFYGTVPDLWIWDQWCQLRRRCHNRMVLASSPSPPTCHRRCLTAGSRWHFHRSEGTSHVLVGIDCVMNPLMAGSGTSACLRWTLPSHPPTLLPSCGDLVFMFGDLCSKAVPVLGKVTLLMNPDG